jgi:uncharacterized membrane protein
MDYLWIFVAIFAAALQTFRSAFQKRMIPEIGKFGATYIRFIYALPFTFLIFIFWFYILDNLIPELNEKAILYCFVGALCQVLFTLLLMIIFSYRNFAAGIAFSKTEVLFAALIETFFFKHNIFTNNKHRHLSGSLCCYISIHCKRNYKY